MCDEILQGAIPARWTRPYQRRGTNWGITNAAGLWLHDGPNIAGFTDKSDALTWLSNPARQYFNALNFRSYESFIE